MEFSLYSLFFGSFLASTILPGGVEGLLYLLVKSEQYSFVALLIVSTAGNTLGGWLTWYVGRLIRNGIKGSAIEHRLKRWFTLQPKSMERVQRYGPGALFFSWLPIIGDPLCVAAGYLGLPFVPCALAIFIGKAVRYVVLLWFLFQL